MLEKRFKLSEHKTTVGTEVMAGLATFLTAVYILVVNPNILTKAGMPHAALFTATGIGMIIGTFLMGWFANMPFLLAPGMGINMYFAYAVVLGKGYSWQEALTATLVAGVLFVIVSAAGIREILVKGFPEALKSAMTVALGLMIAVIGMSNCGLVVFMEGHVAMGDVSKGSPLLAMIGLLITGVLVALRVPAAILIGIALTTLAGIPKFIGVTDYAPLLKSGAISMPPSIAPIAMAFSLDWSRLLTLDFLVVVVAMLAVDLFDSLGTFVGVLNRFEGKEREKYEERVPRALLCDAVATVLGACAGTSTVTTYVESSTGIDAGGRTGLTAITIVLLTVAALFASPMFFIVPAAATAPALIIVGMHMMGMAAKIRFSDVTEGLPAIVIILVTALTWSISDGLMYGWIGYVVFKLLSGKTKELNLTVLAVGAFFMLRVILL